MTIAVGETLPDATFLLKGPEGIEKLTTTDIFGGKKVALFGVPGAFTPTCHSKHLPGYLEALGRFSEKGVDTVACMSVNDPHVMKAWADATDADGKIVFLSDGNAEFTKAAGLEFDGSLGGMGMRSKRFSMLVDDRVVKDIHVEPAPGQAIETSAENLLLAL